VAESLVVGAGEPASVANFPANQLRCVHGSTPNRLQSSGWPGITGRGEERGSVSRRRRRGSTSGRDRGPGGSRAPSAAWPTSRCVRGCAEEEPRPAADATGERQAARQPGPPRRAAQRRSRARCAPLVPVPFIAGCGRRCRPAMCRTSLRTAQSGGYLQALDSAPWA